MTLDLHRLAQKAARLESEAARANAVLREARRRDDTRRRIVLGGAVQAAVRDGSAPDWLLSALIAKMSDRDRALFTDAQAAPGSELEGAGQ